MRNQYEKRIRSKQRKIAYFVGGAPVWECPFWECACTISHGPACHFRSGANDLMFKHRQHQRLWAGLAALLAIACSPVVEKIFAQQKTEVELTVAAAADLSSALGEISDNYQKQTGVKVKLSLGASGALTQQIQNGAPFDIFFSADMGYPQQLIQGGHAYGASLFEYAVGRLVLWVPADSPLDVEHKGIEILLDPAVKKIALGNPEHAPYGRAAEATLRHYGMYDRVKDRLVRGENIAQAAQFVESGNAQAGFVALAHAASPAMKGKGKYWVVPQEAYPPLAQGVVMLMSSQHRPEAAAFLNYIKTREAGDVLRKYGFAVP